LGKVHPATISLVAVVTIAHLTISALSVYGPFVAYAKAVAG